MTNQTAVKVAKGAELLDERFPGWADRIDVGALHMGDPMSCVLGQLHPGYAMPFTTGMVALFGEEEDITDAIDHGFDTARGGAGYSALEWFWKIEINKRRNV